MADQMTDYFHAHKGATTHDVLSHKHAFHVRACDKPVVLVMHAAGVYSVNTPCVHTPSNCRCYVLAIRNCMLEKNMSLTALRQALKNATTMNSNFAMRNSAMMRTTKTKYAAGFPAALCTVSTLCSDQQT